MSSENLICDRLIVFPNRHQLDAALAGGPAFRVFLPVPEPWVPRPCVLCKGGYDVPVPWGLLCPAACIAPTANITCTLSLALATGGYRCCAPHAAGTLS